MFKNTPLTFLSILATVLFGPFNPLHAESGNASVHDPRSRRERRTASGESWNSGAMVAAHKTARLGSWLRVIDPATRRTAWVRIVDRGPYRRSRVIDLSPAAARQLGRPYGIFRVRLVR